MSWRGQSLDVDQQWAARSSGAALAAAAVLSVATWMPPIAAADGTPVVINCSQPAQVKPDRVILTCADNTDAVDKIVWTSWSAISGVTGHGIEYRTTASPAARKAPPPTPR